MTVIKNQKSNTYEVRTYYKDWTGVRKQKTKRGFKRKCDAQEWERAFKLKENLSLDMYFEDFVDLYLNDIKSRIKYNTWLTKKHIVEKKILPYFSKKKLQEIKPSDIRQWQNTMMNYRNNQGEGYSQGYSKTIHNQLSAILNHAVNFYDLKSNAAPVSYTHLWDFRRYQSETGWGMKAWILLIAMLICSRRNRHKWQNC